MHNKFEQDTWKTFEVIVPTRSNYWCEMRKISINRPFWIFFSAIIELVRVLVICLINLGRIHKQLFKLSCPQLNANADVAKLGISHLFKFRGGLKISQCSDGEDGISVPGVSCSCLHLNTQPVYHTKYGWIWTCYQSNFRRFSRFEDTSLLHSTNHCTCV